MININCFHFLRFSFAILIFLDHLQGLTSVEAFNKFEFVGQLPAVNAFFIMSGFLVAKSYINSTSLKNYILKRIKRIVPAYLVIILLAAFLLFFMSSLSFSEYFTHPAFYKYIAWNSIFLNFKAPFLPEVFNNEAVNGALWTIKIEECFYLLVPIIFLIMRKFDSKKLYIFIIIYILSLIYRNYFFSIGQLNIAKQIPGAMTYFVVGIVMFLHLEYVLIIFKLFLIGLNTGMNVALEVVILILEQTAL